MISWILKNLKIYSKKMMSSSLVGLTWKRPYC